MTEDKRVALWYMSYGSPGFDVYDSEMDAAMAAAAMVDHGYASPIGVQFSDGTTLERESWPAYREAEVEYDRRSAKAMEIANDQWKQKNRRMIMSPFLGSRHKIEIDSDDTPEWVGIPV